MARVKVSRRSVIGLNAVNFFLAEVVGVIMPFLAAFLKDRQWSFSEIGVASASAGLGTLLFQTPAGFLSDRIENRRLLLGVSSLFLGASYGLLPSFSQSPLVTYGLLFVSGVAGAFFVPLLASLALALAGEKDLPRIMGQNQGWNHAGNITAAVAALAIVKWLGVTAVFYVMATVSILAAASLLLINGDDLKPTTAHGRAPGKKRKVEKVLAQVRDFVRDPCVVTLLICVGLFHIANAPTMPLLGLYLKHLTGDNSQVAQVVLVAQAVMIPVALLAGKYGERIGRKKVFAVAFVVLPLRIILYSFTTNPKLLLAFQCLDGIGAGIYGVVIALVCSDLTGKRGGFNTLMGLSQTALALGGFVVPLVQGYLTDHLGFAGTFVTFAAIAAVAAVIFMVRMPETKGAAHRARVS